MRYLNSLRLAIGKWFAEPGLWRQYLVLSLTLSVLYAVINPPIAINDEHKHWARTYEITEGRLVTKSPGRGRPRSQIVPEGYVRLIDRYLPYSYQWETRVPLPTWSRDLTAKPRARGHVYFTSGADGYNLVPYVPAVIGVGVGRLLNLPFLLHLYLARLASLLTYCFISAYAVRIAGRFKWPLALFGLTPMVLTQAAGLNADVLCNALAMVFFAMVARLLQANRECSLRDQLALLAIITVISTCKPVYCSMALVLPLLRYEGRWNGLLRRAGLFAATVAAALMVTLVWSRINRDDLAPDNDPSAGQLAWMREHPVDLFWVVVRTVYELTDNWIIEIVAYRPQMAKNCGFWGHTITVCYVSLLAFVSIGLYRSVHKSKGQRWLAASLLVQALLLTLGGAALAMYLTFNKIGESPIRGIQGRYLHPVIPGLLLAAAFFGRPTLSRWLTANGGKVVLTTVVILNFATLSGLIGRYYIPYAMRWPL